MPDLLIAAVAERAALCVLHCDEDYDRIATVTNQSVQYEGTPYLPSRPYIWLDRALGTYRLRILSK